MRYIAMLFIVSLGCLAGCASVDPLTTFESDDLVVIKHNEYNNYILMVYQDPLGQTRHVLRRNGITELVVTYTMEGAIELKLRGQKPRKVDALEAGRVTQRINSLLTAKGMEAVSI